MLLLYKAVLGHAAPFWTRYGDVKLELGVTYVVPAWTSPSPDPGMVLGRRGFHACTTPAACFVNTGFHHAEHRVLRVGVPDDAQVAWDPSGVFAAAAAIHVLDVLDSGALEAALAIPRAIRCPLWGFEVWTRFGCLHRTDNPLQEELYERSAASRTTPWIRVNASGRRPFGGVRCVPQTRTAPPSPPAHHVVQEPTYVNPKTGTRAWMWRGKFHRSGDQPAVETRWGQYWYRHGVLHRDPVGDELPPAVVMTGGAMEWYVYGALHRVQPSQTPSPALFAFMSRRRRRRGQIKKRKHATEETAPSPTHRHRAPTAADDGRDAGGAPGHGIPGPGGGGRGHGVDVAALGCGPHGPPEPHRGGGDGPGEPQAQHGVHVLAEGSVPGGGPVPVLARHEPLQTAAVPVLH